MVESNYRPSASQPTVRPSAPTTFGRREIAGFGTVPAPIKRHDRQGFSGAHREGMGLTAKEFRSRIRPNSGIENLMTKIQRLRGRLKCRKRVISNRLGRCLAGLAFVLTVTSISADDLSVRDPFFARLSTPMTSIQDGKPFREALQSIADQVELNIWLDRRVDPTSPVSAGPLKPTVAAAIEKIAEQRDCVMMPVAGVVLVGRPSWVDATAATLLWIETPENRQTAATVSWDALSTPETACGVAAGAASIEVSPPLPHDLWPAVRWRQIDRRVAVALILAQFDLRPQSPLNLTSIRCEPATREAACRRRYSAGKTNAKIRQAIERLDPKATARITDGWLEVTATPAAHWEATAEMLAAESKKVTRDPEGDTLTFSLNPTRATAGDLLRSFAKTAGRDCVIDPAAKEACDRIVTIEADQQTLRQLIDRVAQEASVSAQWKAGAIVITATE